MTKGSLDETMSTSPQQGSQPGTSFSVVVPVYNTGPYIEPCIESLLGQTLPSTAYEVIFVDDGSTDGTPARLDEVASRHPNVSVIHIPNSGWPGKPRNLGIDAAKGEYVYFVDHDDWLAPGALERMYDMAKRNGADVIIGKIAGHGRRVPRTLFRQNYEKCDLATAPLMESLTPHKGFRLAFLKEHGLRFPEGRRRLEDHVFVVEAYLRANVISVLADYTCYHHTAREDRRNAGFTPLEPVGYYANLREAIDVVERLTEPGELRYLVLRRWYRVEMLRRVTGKTFLAHDPTLRREIYREVRNLALERFTSPQIWEPLPPQHRVASELLRGGRYEELLDLARFEASLQLHIELQRVDWQEGDLVLEALLTVLTSNGGPAVTISDGVKVYMGAAETVATPARVLGGTEQARAEVQLRLRHGDTRLSWPMQLAQEPGEGFDVYRMSGSIDRSFLSGDSLATGVWDVFVRLRDWGAGPDLTRRLGRGELTGSAPPATPMVIRSPRILLQPYWTENDNLSFRVGQRPSEPVRDVKKVRRRLRMKVRRRLRMLLSRTRPDDSLS